MEKNGVLELSCDKKGNRAKQGKASVKNLGRQNNSLVVSCDDLHVESAVPAMGGPTYEAPLGAAVRGNNNRKTGRKTRLLQKFWNQVTSTENSHGRRAIVYSETVVEDSVAEICALPAATPVDVVILPKIRSLDSRALAALLKDLGRVDKSVRAFEIFDLLRSRSDQPDIRQLLDIYTYTTIVSVCTLEKDLERALSYVAELHRKGIKCNNHFYSAVMNACKKCGEFDLALVIFEEMRRKGCKPNVITYNTLIDIYGKMAQSNKAIEVLKTMRKEGLQPAIRTYNTAMIACNMSNKPEEALKVYNQITESSVEPISTTYTALIMTYGKLKMLDKAIATFNRMVSENLERTSVTYANLLAGCEIAENAELGLYYFNRMFQEGIQPSTAAFNSVISLMCTVGDWKKATEVFEYAHVCKCAPDAATFNTLFATYNKFGEWQKICTLFEEEIQSGCPQDISVFGTVIDALWCTGHLRYQAEALHFYNEARKTPNLKAKVDMEARDGGWNVWVPVASVGIAVFALHKWLTDMRLHFDRYPVDMNSEVMLKITRNRRDKCSEDIKDVFVRILRSMGAIFNIGDTEASAPFSINFSLALFRVWLLKPETALALSALIGLKACDLKDAYAKDEHNISRLSFESSSQQNIANRVFDAKCLETLRMMRQHEESHKVNFGLMAINYITLRPQLVLRIFKLTRECGFEQSHAFDAIVLMDLFMQNRVAFNEFVYLAITAALFRIVVQINDAPERVPGTVQLDALMEVPVGSVAKIEYDLRTLLSNNFRVVSVYRVAKLYYEWLSYSQEVPWVKLVLIRIFKLLQLCLLSNEMSEVRPTVAAAAVIIHDRHDRGWIPEWPTALAYFTGFDDVGSCELSTAIEAVSRLEKISELSVFPQ